jgi:hypothetical protein
MSRSERRYVLQPDAPVLAVATIFVILGVFVVWWLPRHQVKRLPYSHLLESEKRFDKENDARKTIIQIVGGLAFLGTFYVGYGQLRISQDAQFATRLQTAITKLRSDDRLLTVGAVDELERLTHDSPRDQGPVMRTLTAYLHEVTPVSDQEECTEAEWRPQVAMMALLLARPTEDVQAILATIGRRDPTYDPLNKGIFLNWLNLHGVQLENAHLEGLDLSYSHLEGANLKNAYLNNAKLVHTNLRNVDLTNAHLEHADLSDTQLQGATLKGVHLEHANFNQAQLTTGRRQPADGVVSADLDGAFLQGANLKLAMVRKEQVQRATLDSSTIMPERFFDDPLLHSTVEPPPDLGPVCESAEDLGPPSVHTKGTGESKLYDEANRRAHSMAVSVSRAICKGQRNSCRYVESDWTSTSQIVNKATGVWNVEGVSTGKCRCGGQF